MNKMVSIYIVSHNRSATLERAINSCLQQTYKNIEIIVVDDCSTDFNFTDFIQTFSDKRIRWFQMDSNRGANACRNKALAISRGEYVTGLDDDDFFHPHRIETLYRAYKNSRYSFVTSRFLNFEPNQIRKLTFPRLLKLASQWIIPRQEISIDKFLNDNPATNQVFTNKTFLLDCGGFDESLPAFQDYDMWLRLTQKYGTGLKLSKFLYFRELSKNSISKRNQTKVLGFDMVIDKHQQIFEGKEHCVELHRLKYLQGGKLLWSQATRLFKKYNRNYLVKLFLRGKLKKAF